MTKEIKIVLGTLTAFFILVGMLFTAYKFVMDETREIVRTEIKVALTGGQGNKLDVINNKLDSLIIGKDFNQ